MYGDGWGGARPDKRMKYVYMCIGEREREESASIVVPFRKCVSSSIGEKKKDRFSREFHENSSSRGVFNIDEERKSLDGKIYTRGVEFIAIVYTRWGIGRISCRVKLSWIKMRY